MKGDKIRPRHENKSKYKKEIKVENVADQEIRAKKIILKNK